MKDNRIRTEADFQALMELVDAELRAEGVDIPARPLRACSKLAVKLSEPFVHPTPKREPVEGVYTGDDLTIRVDRWFDERYGDRLKMSFSPGSVVVLIRGDPWQVRLPFFAGAWDIITQDPVRPVPEGIGRIGQRGDPPLQHNCLRDVVDLPDGLRTALTIRERAAVLLVYRAALDAFNSLNSLSGDLFAHSRADVDGAVNYIVGTTRNAGLSKWASLQAAEKTLKGWLRMRGKKFPHSHDLVTLARNAVAAGLPVLDERALAAIQCEPRVRYGEVNVAVPDAVTAHQNSLWLARHVAASLGVPSLFDVRAF